MLTELYQYAMDKGLAARPGFKKKAVKAYVLLSESGKFLGINVRDKKADQVYAPDIGSAAQGTQFCNVLIEKAKYPLGMVDGKTNASGASSIITKRKCYLAALEDGASAEPLLSVLKTVLEDKKAVGLIRDSMVQHKLKGDDVIGFQIDGFPLEKSKAFAEWWSEYRGKYTKGTKQSDVVPRCMITGELMPAMKTVPKVPGLLEVGGHSSGDALLCFDKDAFQSYGLKQSSNAAVSEEAMTAVNSALTELVGSAPILGGAKIVHWYSKETSDKSDPVEWVMDPDLISDMQDFEEEMEEEKPEPGDREREALNKSREMLNSIHKGINTSPPDPRYYIMPLSGAGGRMMVRGWYEGDFGELQENIRLWFDDLSLINWNGKGRAKNPKLVTLYIRLLKPGKDGKNIFDRIEKELAGLSTRILYSIIKGLPLPDEVPIRAVRWINSGMADENKGGEGLEKENKMEHEMPAFQLLKAWLRREQRKRGESDLMETGENRNVCRGTAYYCGQLMAIYVAIQKSAMPEAGVGLAQRYYTAAGSNPAFVIGRLSQLSQHYLAKLDGGLPVYYEKMLAQVCEKIGNREIPSALNAREQSEFALGYYQKRAQLYGGQAEETGSENV